MAKRMLSGELRGVPCPTCGAKAGEWCKPLYTRPSTPHVDSVHAARRVAAIKKFRPNAALPSSSDRGREDG